MEAVKQCIGKNGLLNMLNNFSDEDQQKVSFGQFNHIYRFGNGRKIKSIHSAKIPAIFGSHNIVTDVVNNDIYL